MDYLAKQTGDRELAQKELDKVEEKVKEVFVGKLEDIADVNEPPLIILISEHLNAKQKMIEGYIMAFVLFSSFFGLMWAVYDLKREHQKSQALLIEKCR